MNLIFTDCNDAKEAVMSNTVISIKMLLCLMSVPIGCCFFLPIAVQTPSSTLMKRMHQTLHLSHQTHALPTNISARARVREKMRTARTKTEWA